MSARPETSEPIPCPSLRAKRSNPRAAIRRSGVLAPRILRPLDCFVARAPRNDEPGLGDSHRLYFHEPSFVEYPGDNDRQRGRTTGQNGFTHGAVFSGKFPAR